MFSSKVSPVLRNIVSKTSYNNGNSISLSSRLLSTDVSTIDSPKQEYVPDKLYKLIEVEVRGNEKAVLTSYGQFATTAANHLKIECILNMTLRKPIHERMTLLKSAHIFKKHRVQYEMRTYFRYLQFAKLTGSTADTFLEYLQRNLPEGVAMKVTKTELNRLPETVTQASACDE